MGIRKIKGKIGLFITTLLFMQMMNVIFVYSTEWITIPDSDNKNTSIYPYVMTNFYSNYTKRFYVFAKLDTNTIGYSSSYDGFNWFSWRILIQKIEPIANDPDDFDIWLEPNGKDFWYAYVWEYPGLDDGLVRKGYLTQTGVHGWYDKEYDISHPSSRHIKSISICSDIWGYPVVLASTYKIVATRYVVYYFVGEYNKGTWKEKYVTGWGEYSGDSFDYEYPRNVKVLPVGNKIIMYMGVYGVNNLYTLNSKELNQITNVYSNNWVIFSDMSGDGTKGSRRWDATSYKKYTVVAYITYGAKFYTSSHKESIAGFGNTTLHDQFIVTAITPQIISNPEGNLTLICYRWNTGLINYTTRYANHTWKSFPNTLINDSNSYPHSRINTPNRNYSPIPIVWYNGSFSILHSYWLGNVSIPFQFINATLYNSDGSINKGWLFQGEVYDLVTYVKNATLFYINFTDSRNNIKFVYDRDLKEMYAETARENVIGVIYTNNQTYSGDVYKLTWRFILGINIVDNVNIDLQYYIYNSVYDSYMIGSTGLTVNIYNLGGKTYYTFSGDAGKVVGGHPYEIYVTNSSIPGGSFAQAFVLKRKWQHFHALFSLDFGDPECPDHDENSGKVQFGIQYMNMSTGSYESSFRVNLYVYSGAIDDTMFNKKCWIKIKVEWKNYDENGDYVVRKTDYITAWYDGGPDKENRTTARFFVDMWFSDFNDSTIVAGRVNSYYYGMNETGWLLWSNWKPFITSNEVSTFVDDFRNPLGNVISSMDIDLIKHWALVQKLTDEGTGESGDEDCDTHTWTLTNFEEYHHKIADDRMRGIEHPPYEETKIIDMPQSGFVSTIYNAISSLGTIIWLGALKFVRILWSSMGSILIWAFGEGFVGFFSRVLEFIISIPQIIFKLLNQLSFMITYLVDVIDKSFMFLGSTIYRFLYLTGKMITTFLEFWNQLTSLFTGGWSNIGNLWEEWSLEQWIELFLIAVLPMMWLDRIGNSKDPFNTAIGDLKTFIGMFIGTLKFFIDMFTFIKNLISAILDRLPI